MSREQGRIGRDVCVIGTHTLHRRCAWGLIKRAIQAALDYIWAPFLGLKMEA